MTWSGWPPRPTSGAPWRRSIPRACRPAPGPSPDERLSLLRRSLRIAGSRLYKPVDARRFAEEILADRRARRGGGKRPRADPDPGQGLARPGQAAARARRAHRRHRRAREDAVPHRPVRGGAVADLAASARTRAHRRAAGGRARPRRRRARWCACWRCARTGPAWSRPCAATATCVRRREVARIFCWHRPDPGDAPRRRRRHVRHLPRGAQGEPAQAAAVAGLERVAAEPARRHRRAGRRRRCRWQAVSLSARWRAWRCRCTSAPTTPPSWPPRTRRCCPWFTRSEERRARLEKLRALYGGPLRDYAAGYRSALRIFRDRSADRANRDQMIQFAGETRRSPS